MKNRIKTIEAIESWASNYVYDVKKISFTPTNTKLIIDIECERIMLKDTEALIKTIREYFEDAQLHSIDIDKEPLGDVKGMSMWILL